MIITRVLQLEKSFMVAFQTIRIVNNDMVMFINKEICVGSIDLDVFKHKLKLRYKLNTNIDVIFYHLID